MKIEFDIESNLITFHCNEIGFSPRKYFNSYYGSMPVYDEEYSSFGDYDFSIDLYDLLEIYNEDVYDKFWRKLHQDNPNLFDKFASIDGDCLEIYVKDVNDTAAIRELILYMQDNISNFDKEINELCQENADES